MVNLSFFTAVNYENDSFQNKLLDKVDNYFYLGGKKAKVLHTKDKKEEVILLNSQLSKLSKFIKIISYFTLLIPTLMLITKIILRSKHNFVVITPKSELEKGINIKDETIEKLRKMLPKLHLLKDNEIVWLNKGNNLVFKIPDSPNLVFKMARNNVSVSRGDKSLNSKEIAETRFINMIKAKEVCLINKLGQLIIPHAKKIEIKIEDIEYNLIVEEALDIHVNESMQEILHHKFSTKLNETVRQLAILISKTGFNDVVFRNIPILNEAQNHQEASPALSGRVALIDLEHMESVINGFLGDDNGSCGLIGCLSTLEQMNIVIEEAQKQGINISENDLNIAKERRFKELEYNKKLSQFHEKNAIVTGKEPLKVDIESLGLNLSEEGWNSFDKKNVTLREITEEVILEINKLILNSSDTDSIKGKRKLVLNTSGNPFVKYRELGPKNKMSVSEKNHNQLWLRQIIQALIAKGHLFELEKVNEHGYFIQA